MRRDEEAASRRCRRDRAGEMHVRAPFHRGDMGFEPLFGVIVDHRSHIDARIARVTDFQFGRGARDHPDHAVCDIFLHAEEPQGRAALPGRAESRGDDIIGDLFGKRGRIDNHRIDAAGLGDQRHDGTVFGRERAIDVPGDFGRAGEGDAGDARIGDECGAERAVARREMQRRGRNAGAVEQFDRRGGDERRLFGRFRHHDIAGGECRRDLAEEDREREIPWADANKQATTAIGQAIVLAGGTGHCGAGGESRRASAA